VEEESRPRHITGGNFSTHSTENKLKNILKVEKKQNHQYTYLPRISKVWYGKQQ